jgi:hypothetical protein
MEGYWFKDFLTCKVSASLLLAFPGSPMPALAMGEAGLPSSGELGMLLPRLLAQA